MKLKKAEASIFELMDKYGITFLRLSVAVVFIWFGLLKILGVSPVGNLVASTVFFLPKEIFVPFLGVWEVAIGLGFLFKVPLRITLILFLMQMAGTFLVLIVQPEIAFQNNNPLLLTTIGEFVIKNIVLISAGIVVASSIKKEKR